MLKTGKKAEDDKGYAYDKITEQKTQTPAPSPGNTAEKRSLAKISPLKATFVEMNILLSRVQ